MTSAGAASTSEAAFPGANGEISFTSQRLGGDDLFAIAPAGSGLRSLTTHPAGEAQSAWSPDGTRVAFRSNRDGNYEVYVMDAGGAGQTRITSAPPANSTQPSWSPDGGRLLFRSNRDGDYDIWEMEATGANVRQVLNEAGDDRYPGYSPDGRRIVFISNRDGDYEIYMLDVASANVAQLTHNAVLDSSPAWTPNGTKIAFRSERDGQSEIYAMGADGTAQQRLTVDPALDEGPAWAPDGSRIAFTTDRDGNGEIYVMGADGSSPLNVTRAASRELSPDWQALPASVPGAGAPAPSPGVTADRTAPRLGLRAGRRQRAVRRRALVIRVSCSEACRMNASAVVRIGGGRTPLRLTTASRTLHAGVATRVRLGLSRRARRMVRRALSARGFARAAVAVTAGDDVGNRSTGRRSVRIVG